MNSKNKKGPDFIGIGMERAGTSWLFTQIASHPDIWVPPLKELHFFDVIDPQARYLKHRYSYHLKSRIKQKAAPFVDTSRRPEFNKNSYLAYLLWDYYFFTGRFSTGWYRRLFDPVFTKGRVSGEITPAYSNLTKETIKKILDMNPDVKFILMVRNPTQRLWSGVIHHFSHVKKRDFETVSEEEMIEYLNHPVSGNRSDLELILDTWQSMVPPENLLIQSFELIANSPEKLIQSTYEFLGVDTGYMPPEDLYKRKINDYNKKFYMAPQSVMEIMWKKCQHSFDRLEKTHPEIVENWDY